MSEVSMRDISLSLSESSSDDASFEHSRKERHEERKNSDQQKQDDSDISDVISLDRDGDSSSQSTGESTSHKKIKVQKHTDDLIKCDHKSEVSMGDISLSVSESSSDDASFEHSKKERHKERKNSDQQKSSQHSEASSEHSEASLEHSEASSEHSEASSERSEASPKKSVLSRLRKPSAESFSASQSSQHPGKAKKKGHHKRKTSSQQKDDSDISDVISLDRDGDSSSQSTGEMTSRKKIKVQNHTDDLIKYGCKDVKVRLRDISSIVKDISIIKESNDVTVLTPKRPSTSIRPKRPIMLSDVEENDYGRYRTRRKDQRKNYREIESDEDDSEKEENAEDSDWEEEPILKEKRRHRKKDSSDDSEEESSRSEKKESDDDLERRKKKKVKKEKIHTKKINSEPTPLSEYEKMIQKNRDDKMAFLQSLAMNELKDEFASSVKKLKPKREKGEKKPKEVYDGPPRKSDRANKVDINLSEDVLLYNSRRASEAMAETLKKKELPSFLPFEKAFVADEEEEEQDYSNFTNDFFDHVEFESNKQIKNYQTHFEQMKFQQWDNFNFYSTNRITCLEFHPTRDKLAIAAGLQSGMVGFYMEDTESKYTFHPHTGGISQLKFNPDDPMQLFSSSSDNTVRCGDLSKEVFTEVFNTGSGISGLCRDFDFVSPRMFIVAHGAGYVSIVDKNSRSKYRGLRHKCHETSVKSVSVNPKDTNYFVTTDKHSVHLWDLRNLQQKPVKRDFLKLLYTKPKVTYKTIESAYYSPVGNSILLTTNNSIGILDTDLKLKEIKNNPNGTRLKRAIWLPNSDDYFAIGSAQPPTGLAVFDNNINKIYDFSDVKVVSSGVRCAFHPHLPAVTFCGNCSGKPHVFKKDF